MTDHIVDAELVTLGDTDGAPPVATKTDTFNVIEFGLLLPDGEISWGQHAGRPLVTSEDRANLVSVLKATSADVRFPEAEFLSRYRWTSREVVFTKAYPVDHDGPYLSIEDPSVIEPPVPVNPAE